MPESPPNNNSQESWVSTAIRLPTEEPNLKEPKWNSADFFQQRDSHRKWLFGFSLVTSMLSLLFLFGLVIGQTLIRLYSGDHQFEIMSDWALEIFAVAIFGQVFGVVYIIARSVWSNDEFSIMDK